VRCLKLQNKILKRKKNLPHQNRLSSKRKVQKVQSVPTHSSLIWHLYIPKRAKTRRKSIRKRIPSQLQGAKAGEILSGKKKVLLVKKEKREKLRKGFLVWKLKKNQNLQVAIATALVTFNICTSLPATAPATTTLTTLRLQKYLKKPKNLNKDQELAHQNKVQQKWLKKSPNHLTLWILQPKRSKIHFIVWAPTSLPMFRSKISSKSPTLQSASITTRITCRLALPTKSRPQEASSMFNHLSRAWVHRLW